MFSFALRRLTGANNPNVAAWLAGDSEREIDDLDELVGVEQAFAPDGVEIGEGLFRDGFLGGFSGGLQFLHAIAGGDEHVAEFREAGFVAERAVPRNNFGVIAGEREDFIGGGDHAGDIAAGTGGDVGMHAVYKGVAHVDYFGLLKIKLDVLVGV